MAITIRSAQTISNGVTVRGNNTQYITPADPLGKLFELDASTYVSGDWVDLSGNGRNGVIYNAPWASDAGGCFVFNGDSSRRIDVINSAVISGAAGEASFSVWSNITSAGYFQHVAGWRGGINFWFLILQGLSTTEARFDNGSVYDIGMNYSPYFSSWALTTFVVNTAQGYTKLYINGAEVGSNSGMSGNFSSGSNLFSLGTNTGGNFSMTGKIGGAVAYGRALTQQEVTAEYNRTKTRYGL